MTALRRSLPPVLAFLLAVGLFLPVGGPAQPSLVRAADYELETEATYRVRPGAGRIDVTVRIDFTNTTPDPSGRFSVFNEIRLALHDDAARVEASDGDGSLAVRVEMERNVNVATIELREGVRYEDSIALELRYTLPDTEDPQLRVRPSVVAFPAWSFGTAGSVTVRVPSGYEVRVDGDPLEQEGGDYVSGAIADPSRWLALVSAVRPAQYVDHDTTVPLSGGTADLRVRSFADDEPWGTRTLNLLVDALPLFEAEIGLPYPLIGQLVVTEAAPADAAEFGEPARGGTEILVAFDQPPFTVLHQVSHVWLSSSFIEARWIREGMASAIAASIAEELDVEPPYDPAEVAAERADAAFPLDEWRIGAGGEADAYGYAASWELITLIEQRVGTDAVRTVLRRVAASMGPYQAASIEPSPTVEGVSAPASPLSSRAFLDHLETVSGVELSDLFADRVLAPDDAALLEERAAARAAHDDLAEAAGSWGTPDPVRGAMTAWSFADARGQIDDARAWLVERDALIEEMARVGLSASDRLQESYRAYGGGSEAASQLDAHRAVVEAYAETADAVNAERGFVERIGLLGGSEPERELALANGRFAAGDLRGSVEAIAEAQRILASAETSGIVRLVSAALLIALLLGLAVLLFRRRASYTAAP